MEATTIRALENMDLEPVIDLSKSTTPESLLLNVEAELQIMRHRELMQRRRNVKLIDVAEVRVRELWNYTPGAGWDTGIPGRYGGPPKRREPEPVTQRDGDAVLFQDVRNAEVTVLRADGTVPTGNALDDERPMLHWPNSRPLNRRGAPIFDPLLPSR